MILSLSIGWLDHVLALALWLLLGLMLGFGILTILGRWRQQDRWVAYWVALGAVVVPYQLQQGWQLQGSWILLAFGLALVLLLWQRVRDRAADAPAASLPPTTDQPRPPANSTRSAGQ